MDESMPPSRDEALDDAIAIIGMSGRFPGANSVSDFWQNLLHGIDSISHFSDDELEDDFPQDIRQAENFVRARSILEGVDMFDADFFGMYAKEAELTDPQQRVFLEIAWEAIEDAGYDVSRIDGPVGVFGGNSLNTYLLRNVCGRAGVTEDFTSNYQVGSYATLLGSLPDFLATRVSYKLNLSGPSVNVQSACSTSLLAVAQACQSLQMYQSDMALAGGVSITFPQKRGYLSQEGGMVSPDGKCRSFDANASGTVFGSGAAAVLLKRYEDAINDGDRIYAVIRGCGVNNDGADKVGFTAPSVDGQATAIGSALAEADVDPRSIQYVECHGTATPMGDPIEIAGLTKAFRDYTQDNQYCAIGSAKSNLGHLDAAAGVTGLIKTALSLQSAKIPASLHYSKPNPHIDFASTPFYVNAELNDWPQTSSPKRAGVSAFGVGGTNVHVVMQEAPAQQSKADSSSPKLMLFSARSKEALRQAASNLADHIQNTPEQSLDDVAFTLMHGRKAFDHRGVVVANNHAEAIQALHSGGFAQGTALDISRPLVFMFPGQGSQYPDMGRDLYLEHALFRESVDQCAEILKPILGTDIRDLMYPTEDLRAEAGERLLSTVMAQPAIFVVEYALAQLWLKWGLRPAAMIGHSVGEWVAAVLSGVVQLDDALSLVAERGRLMSEVEPGAMLSVRLPEAELLSKLGEELSIAAINAPSLCVVSGPFAAIEALERQLDADEILHRRLHTSHAFHSKMMEPVLEPLNQAVSQISLSPPQIPIISCVSGDYLSEEQATSAKYWADHVRQAVRFSDGVAKLVADKPNPVLLEVGPGNVLTTLSLQSLKTADASCIASLAHPEEDTHDLLGMLESLGKVWAAGAVVPEWENIYEQGASRVSLPTYPFERKRYWIERDQRGQAIAQLDVSSQEQVATADESIQDTSSGESDLRNSVLALLEDLSGEKLDQVSDQTSFLEMGFDSLFLSQVAQKINNAFKVKVTFRQLLTDYSVLGALVEFLEGQGAQGGISAKAKTETSVSSEAAQDARPSRFDVYKRKVDSGNELSAELVAHIKQLADESQARFAESKRSTRDNRKVLADPRAASGFRKEWKELVYPIVVERAKGSRLWDKDGNEYIDLVNGYGQTFFGHSPDFVVDALKEQLDKGFAIGPQAEYAGEVSRMFAEMTGTERVTFCNTGSEAVMAAMRVARTVTGRERIVIFNGDYHGQFDEVLVKGVGGTDNLRSQPIAGGIPRDAVANMVVLEYGAPESLAWITEHGDDIAAVVVEPVQSRHPDLQPFAFLRELRHITKATGSALVFDEVVTGFRTHQGGIQAIAGIQADLATYGKVVGGGLPIGILAGKAEYMDALDGGQWDYGDDSIPEVGVTFFAGTFVRHPMALAATRAVLQYLQQAGPQLQLDMLAKTQGLVARLTELFVRYGIKAKIEQYSSFFYFNLHNEHALAGLLYYHLRKRGLHIQDGFPCFLTTSHSQDDIDRIVAIFDDALRVMSDVGIFKLDHEGSHSQPQLIPLTEPQMEIWLATQMGDQASCVFNESITLHFNGELDSQALHRALQQLVLRHDALRCRFMPTGEGMYFIEEPEFEFGEIDGASDDNTLERVKESEARQAFDLVNGPVTRTKLIHFSENKHALVITSHHIICDGWSANVMVSDLAQLYAAELRQGMAALPAVLGFKDYALEEKQRISESKERVEAYWLEQFESIPEPLDLPSDRSRKAGIAHQGATFSSHIDSETYQQLKQFGAQQGATLFAVLLAGFQVLVGRLAAKTDVAIGVPTAGQSQLEDVSLVGHAVHFLPIRGTWTPETRVSEYLGYVSQQVLDAYDHQGTTLGALVQKLSIPRVQGQVPLTQVQFNLERLDEADEWPALDVEFVPNAKAYVNFDMFLNVIESEQGLRLDCDYSTDLFDRETIEHWLSVYQALLRGFVAKPEGEVAKIDCLPSELVGQLSLLNSTTTSYANDLGLDQIVSQDFARYGTKIAASCGDHEICYADLAIRVSQLAAYLDDQLSITPDTKIAVCVPRSIDTLVAMLAVMRSGAAYVPMDPAHPKERLNYILQDSGATALIAPSQLAESIAIEGVSLIDLHASSEAMANFQSDFQAQQRQSDNLAYVIYTSGSTGKPKGVEISHRSTVNFLQSMAQKPGLTEQDSLLAVTTIAFDISVLELYLPLMVGAKVVIASDEDNADGFKLLELINRHAINTMQATPATWQILLEAGLTASNGFKALVGGEALPHGLAMMLLDIGADVWNMYGPTETTVWSSCQQISKNDDEITVGSPIANTQLYVLDKYQQPLPKGVPGELHIGGDGLARGYLNRAELTSEKFIPNPFAPGRLYRTGDSAKYSNDLGLKILGRIDHQIKLRGYRIELGEIESVILSHPDIAEAAVITREGHRGLKRLVAYIVAQSDSSIDQPQTRAFLAAKLPDYMLPNDWVVLEALPRLPNGKLDRGSLPEPVAGSDSSDDYIAPQTPAEMTLTEIWADVLGMPRIGITDDIFNLGADSIQIFQIVARASSQGLSITARDLMEHRTPASILQHTSVVTATPKKARRGRIKKVYPKTVDTETTGQ